MQHAMGSAQKTIPKKVLAWCWLLFSSIVWQNDTMLDAILCLRVCSSKKNRNTNNSKISCVTVIEEKGQFMICNVFFSPSLSLSPFSSVRSDSFLFFNFHPIFDFVYSRDKINENWDWCRSRLDWMWWIEAKFGIRWCKQPPSNVSNQWTHKRSTELTKKAHAHTH